MLYSSLEATPFKGLMIQQKTAGHKDHGIGCSQSLKNTSGFPTIKAAALLEGCN